MVGPRSSGCRRCVNRRIKCDEARPHCQRCTRANFQCPGYSPPFQFLSLDMTKCSNCLAKNVRCVRNGSKCTRCRKRGLQCDLGKDSFISIDASDSTSSESTLTVRSVEDFGSVSVLTSPTQFNEDIYCAFFLDRCFSFGAWNEELQNNRSWMWSALQSPSESPVSNLALRSVVTAFFGNANHKVDLGKAALELHGQTLRALAQTMKTMGKDVSFDVISAILLLGIYESCHFTNPTAWLDHISGARMLFEIKGAQYFKNRPARSLLMFSRYTMIIEAMISRRRCFLEQQEWKEALRSDDKVYGKTLRLGDLLCSLPGIFEDVRQIEAMEPEDEAFQPKFKNTFDALIMQIDELQNWWEYWSSDPDRLPKRIRIDSELEKNLNEYYPAGVPPSRLGGKPRSVLRLNSLEAAAGYCRYHAHYIEILRWMNRLLLLQNNHLNIVDTNELSSRNLHLVKVDDTSSLLIDAAEAVPHAYAICEALPAYSLPQYRHIGAMYMGWPGRIAWQTLPQGSPHSRWIENFMEIMAEASGFEVPRRVLREIKVNEAELKMWTKMWTT